MPAPPLPAGFELEEAAPQQARPAPVTPVRPPAAGLPPLPPGFELTNPQQDTRQNLPAPPPGFELEQPEGGLGSTIATLARGVGSRAKTLAGGLMTDVAALAAPKAEALRSGQPAGAPVITTDPMGLPIVLPGEQPTDRDPVAIAAELGRSAVQDPGSYTPITPWEDVKAAEGVVPTLLEASKFALEQGVVSLPDMLAALGNLPGYVAARTGEIAQDRAALEGRPVEDADFGYAAGAAVLSSLLERYGAEKVLGRLKGIDKNALARIFGAGVTEATTEAGQENIEYLGERLGTDLPIEAKAALDRMLAGGVGGFGAGVALRTGGEAGRGALNLVTGARPAPETPPSTEGIIVEEGSLPTGTARGDRLVDEVQIPRERPIAEPAPETPVEELPAYHGSPHEFTKFDIGKVGTGEGAQAYGYGLYFAERKGTAETYRANLAPGPVVKAGSLNLPRYVEEIVGKVQTATEDAGTPLGRDDLLELTRLAGNYGRQYFERARSPIQGDAALMRAWIEDKLRFERDLPGPEDKNKIGFRVIQAMRDLPSPQLIDGKGALYEVDIPDEVVDRMVDWDAPFKDQPANVQRAFRVLLSNNETFKAWTENGALESAPSITGEMLYKMIAGESAKIKPTGDHARFASEVLLEEGVPGLKYYDAQSRTGGRRLKAPFRGTKSLQEFRARTDGVLTTPLEQRIGDVVWTNRFEEGNLEQKIQKIVSNWPKTESKDVKGLRKPTAEEVLAVTNKLTDAGTRNLVTFTDDYVNITSINGKPVAKPEPKAAPEGEGEGEILAARYAAPTEDSVLQYLAKTRGPRASMRGLSTREAIAQGFDPAEIKTAGGYGIQRAFTKGGMSFDSAAELLAEAGYPVRDERGNYDLNKVVDLIREELSGRPVYSSANEGALEEEYGRIRERYRQPGDEDVLAARAENIRKTPTIPENPREIPGKSPTEADLRARYGPEAARPPQSPQEPRSPKTQQTGQPETPSQQPARAAAAAGPVEAEGKVEKLPPGENYVGMYRGGKAPKLPTETILGAAEREGVLEVPKKPIRREHVMELFQRLFKVKVYQGKPFKVRQALGFFRPKNYEVRIRDKNDLEVTAHEVFHWLDRTYPTLRKLYHEKRFSKELLGVSYDQALIFEGFAEFGRLFMTQEVEAITRTPTFYEAFVTEAQKLGILKDLERVQRLMHQWYLQGAVARADSKRGTQKMPLPQRIASIADGAGDRAIAASLDWLHAFKVIERETTGDIGQDATYSPYKSARLLAGAKTIVNTWLNYGTQGWTARGDLTLNGKGLKQIFEPVAEVFDDAMAYFVGRRAAELKQYGKENLFGADEIVAMLDRGRNSEKRAEIERAFDEYQLYTKRLLDFAEASGILNPNTRAIWDEMYKNYVPFYRVAETLGGMETSKPIGGVFKRLTGGTANLRDTFENITLNTKLVVTASLRNVVKRQLYAAIESSPLGQRYAVAIGTDVKPASFGIEQIERVLREMSKKAKEQALEEVKRTGDKDSPYVLELLQISQLAAALGTRSGDLGQVELNEVMQQATFWMSGQPPSIPDKDFVLVRGKPKYYQIGDPLLWKALEQINYHKPISLVDKIFGAPKRLLTRGVTITLDFQIANIIRDTISAFTMSRGGQIPFVDAIKSLRDIWTESEDFVDFLGNGGGYGNAVGDEARRIRVELSKIRRGNLAHAILLDTPAKLLDVWDKWGQSFELASRLAEYKRIRKRGGSRREAAFQGREISTDFAMHGHSAIARFAMNSLPFFNARLQGLYRIERELFERGGRQTLNGERQLRYATLATMTLTVPSMLLYWFVQRDDDDYEALPEEIKSLYTGIPLGDGLTGLIPRPFETGAIFQEIPVRMLEYAVERDGEKFVDAMMFMIGQTFAFSPVPQLVAPPVSVAMNRQWNGLPVVPDRLQGVEPKFQSQPWTSETFKRIGEQFNVSPLKLEALFNGYLGTVGMYALMASDALIAGGSDEVAVPARRLSEYPVLRRFMREQPLRNTSYEQKFYDLAEEVMVTVNSANLLRTQGRAEEFGDYMGDNERQILFSLNAVSSRVRQQASAINAQLRRIRYSGVLSSEEKLRQEDELRAEQNALFKEAVNAFDDADWKALRDALEEQ